MICNIHHYVGEIDVNALIILIDKYVRWVWLYMDRGCVYWCVCGVVVYHSMVVAYDVVFLESIAGCRGNGQTPR